MEFAKEPKSCTILIRGPNKHTIDQIKGALCTSVYGVTVDVQRGVDVGVVWLRMDLTYGPVGHSCLLSAHHQLLMYVYVL